MTHRSRNHLLTVFGAAVVWLCALAFAAPETAFAQVAGGSITVASGAVQIQRGGATLPARAGMQVNVGDRVITGADGHTLIILGDQSRLEMAVKGMLPKNRLGHQMFNKLKVYRGAEHPHAAQKATLVTL